MARWIIITGVVLVIVGLLWQFAPGLFKWLGRLPGDIRIERENFRLYFPITTMLIISIVVSLIIYLMRK